MAPKRKATKVAVAAAVTAKTEPDKVVAAAQDATEQIIETKKSNKKAAASKKETKPEMAVANDDRSDISPKQADKRPRRENAKKVVNYVEEKIEPMKKKSRAKKAPAESVEADENSENDKRVANNSAPSADGNTKKRTKKNAVKEDSPTVDTGIVEEKPRKGKSTKSKKEENEPVKEDAPTVDTAIVEEKPKKGKSTKSKKEENEPVAEVQAAKRKPRSKAEPIEATESAKAEEQTVSKGRKRKAKEPDQVVANAKETIKSVKKTIDASPEKMPVQDAQKPDEADVKVERSSGKKTKVLKDEETTREKKRTARTARMSTGGKAPRYQKKGESESDETSNDDIADRSQNFSSDEEPEPPKKEPVRSPKGAKPRKPLQSNDTAVTKRNKNEKNAKAEPKQKINSTATDYTKINFDSAKEYTTKICSWNVAGLRGLVAKNGFEYFEHEKPDIICLQEIKCLEDEVPAVAKIPGYHLYCCSKPGGRAGVALLTKKMPYNVDYDIGDAEMDEEGRLITAEYSKFYLVCVYVPNAGRGLVNLDRRLRWNKLFEQHVNKLKANKPVVIVGDMNVAHTEIDLANPKTNTKNAGFTVEERNGMTFLLNTGFVDTFRHLYPEQKNAYTFWSYMGGARAKNVGWRLDYGIVSENIASKVVDNIIRSEVVGSDHCPMVLLLDL